MSGAACVVLDSWQVHHDNVAGANVVVGVPDIDRDVDKAPIVFGNNDTANLSTGWTVRTGIEQDKLPFPLVEERNDLDDDGAGSNP